MKIADMIRKTLRECGEPMTMAQLADANGWDAVDRAAASRNLYNMKHSGEVTTEVTEEKVHYALNTGYVGRGKQRGPGIHVAKADGARAKARAAVVNVTEDVSRNRIEVPIKDWPKKAENALDRITENVRGDGHSIVTVCLSPPAVKLLDRLVRQGLHGITRGEAARHLIYRALERMLP